MDTVKIEIDVARKLVRVVCSGFWTIEDAHEFDRRQRAALAEMARAGCPAGDVLLLIDTRGQAAQSQDVIREIDRLMASPDHRVKTSAILVSSALLARQTDRIGPQACVFFSEADAIAHLLATA